MFRFAAPIFSIIHGMSTTSTSSGWNRSTSTPKPAPKKPSAMRGVVAGLVVVVIASVCAVIFMGKGEKPVEKVEKERGHIKEATPAAAPKAVPEKPKQGSKEWTDNYIKEMEGRYGTNMPVGLKTYIHYLKNPPQKTFKAMRRFKYLRHHSERVLAQMLTVEPGTYFLDKPEYGEDFNQDFINAMLDKIEIEPDDDEETKQVKEFVTNAKKELAALVKAEGRKPNEFLNEHAALMYDLGQFEENLAKELRDAENNPDMTDQDVEDIFRAANELRKKKGLAERKIPDLTSRSIELKRQQRRAERKAAREAAAKQQQEENK